MGSMAKLGLVVGSVLLASCSLLGGGEIRIVGERRFVEAVSDGTPLTVYELKLRGDERKLGERRAVLFYLQGSESESVLGRIGQLAGAATMNTLVVLMERREVGLEGEVDPEDRARHSTLEQRVSDHRSVLEDYLGRLALDVPVILMGGSEGGIVATELAEKCPRVSHLALIGSGGGWTQAREFQHFLKARGGYLGLGGEAELQTQLDAIRSEPHSTEKSWAGHSYRHWSSFLWFDPLEKLVQLEIPVLVLHGTRDGAVPVESARAIEAEFERLGKRNLTYREYEGLDHSMKRQDGASGFPLLEIDILRWLADSEFLSESEQAQFEHRVRRNHPELFEDN